MLADILEKKKIVIYGLSTETERILNEWDGKYNVIGLLDGFKTFGTQFGYPIVDINDVAEWDNVVIIVIARPGSCKSIAKRIGDLCRKNNIELYDIRGKNLLADVRVVYDFSAIPGYTKADLLHASKDADVLSFDLFDTLVVRSISSFESLLRIIDIRLKEKGIYIPDFVNKRIKAEKILSIGRAPRLTEIYTEILKECTDIAAAAKELADFEYSIDLGILNPRKDVVELIHWFKKNDKRVYITSDSYYSKKQIEEILGVIGIEDVCNVIVSCEYNIGKTGGLFEELIKLAKTKNILHIGDDIVADIESASRYGIKSFQIYSSVELLDRVGRLKLMDDEYSVSDQIRIGMFTAVLFNSPFQFEDNVKRIHVNDSKDIGYLFCAPMIMDFVKWFEEETIQAGIENIWFCARDGYLLKRLYEFMYPIKKAEYFYTSRISAIRAGMESMVDVEYVDSMEYSGEIEDKLKTRFGINADELDASSVNSNANGLMKYSKAILDMAKIKKNNNIKYIEKLSIKEGGISFFDFVAKGTSQMYIQKLIANPIRGLYFLQLEPEFMKDKNLDIKAFYTEAERETSAIFDNYYILETLLTSPDASVNEFDVDGNPIFAKETREMKEIACFMRVQEGIMEYVKKYINICPKGEIKINKKLDEILLTLIHNVEIRDKDFLDLTVEDPFFNRMVSITDIL